jgi:hypothetical protein
MNYTDWELKEKKKQKTLTEWLKNSATSYVQYLPVYSGKCYNSTLDYIMTTFFLILSIHRL